MGPQTYIPTLAGTREVKISFWRESVLKIRSAGVPSATIVLEPSCKVNFILPPPVDAEEMGFFDFRWSWERAMRSNRRVEERWGCRTFRALPELLAAVQPEFLVGSVAYAANYEVNRALIGFLRTLGRA